MIEQTCNSTSPKNQTHLDALILIARRIIPLFAVSAILVYLLFVWVSFDPDVLWKSGDKGGAIRLFYLILTFGLTSLLYTGIELFWLNNDED